MEKNAPFFILHKNSFQFSIYRTLVSETTSGSTVPQLPEASCEDKDTGSLAPAQMHLDTDLNGPV